MNDGYLGLFFILFTAIFGSIEMIFFNNEDGWMAMFFALIAIFFIKAPIISFIMLAIYCFTISRRGKKRKAVGIGLSGILFFVLWSAYVFYQESHK